MISQKKIIVFQHVSDVSRTCMWSPLVIIGIKNVPCRQRFSYQFFLIWCGSSPVSQKCYIFYMGDLIWFLPLEMRIFSHRCRIQQTSIYYCKVFDLLHLRIWIIVEDSNAEVPRHVICTFMCSGGSDFSDLWVSSYYIRYGEFTWSLRHFNIPVAVLWASESEGQRMGYVGDLLEPLEFYEEQICII